MVNINFKKYLLITIITLTVLIFSYVIFQNTNIFDNSKNTDNTNNGTQNNEENNVSDNNNNTDEIKKFIDSMTLEQKVGQLFICAFRKDANNNNIYSLNNETISIINKYNLGGVILFGENMQNANQLKKLTLDISNINKDIPLFISVDAEGGLVDRIAKSSIVEDLPYISKLGQTNDYSLAYEYSKIIGRRLSSLGFNLDFAPVCDLNNSDAITYRSFGKDSATVSKMVESYVKGLNEYMIGSVLKHFPGIGSSVGDTHNEISHSSITLEQLEKSDFLPFKSGINAGSDVIMINHVQYDNLSSIKLPASLNKDIYTILRNSLNFNGIVITDGLEMKAITEQNIEKTPAYTAFVSGADILLLPQDISKSYNEILNAVKNGDIPISRLDTSVERIIRYKEKLGIFEKNKTKPNLNDPNDKNVIYMINNY